MIMAHNTLKTINRTEDTIIVGNYIIMFGARDLTGGLLRGYNTGDRNDDGSRGQYFTEQTAVKSAYTELGAFPVDWEHGQEEKNGEPGRGALGYVDWKTAKKDNKGWFVQRVLDRRNAYIAALDEAGFFENGLIGTSSESDVARVSVERDGHITSWPLIKDTLTVQPFDPRMLGENSIAKLKSLSIINQSNQSNQMELNDMENDKLNQISDGISQLAEGIKAIGARVDSLEATLPITNDPGIGRKSANVIFNTNHWKYDNMSTEELGFAIGVVNAAKGDGRSKRGVSPDAFKALALRLETEEAQRTEAGRYAAHAAKAAGVKANEINQSTLAGYGDEWVGQFYSGNLWENIRRESAIVSRIPTIEVPAGAESVTIPLESTDPTWYRVAQAANVTSGNIVNTVTASGLGTANKTLSLGKMGARVVWTGELEEDTVFPYAAQLQRQLVVSGAEHLESAVIDGDTEPALNANINNAGGLPGSEYWTIVNGFRKLALVTNTANSRSAGALTSSDFLETVKLMGVGGANADVQKTGFIIPFAVHWKALELADVKTRDVFAGATIEAGRLAAIYGYPVYVTSQMHKAQPNRLCKVDGYIDLALAGNNTSSALLAVRFDQWLLGWRRRMTFETTRVPAADSTEIVALMRFGLAYRDVEASAISYEVTI